MLFAFRFGAPLRAKPEGKKGNEFWFVTQDGASLRPDTLSRSEIRRDKRGMGRIFTGVGPTLRSKDARRENHRCKRYTRAGEVLLWMTNFMSPTITGGVVTAAQCGSAENPF